MATVSRLAALHNDHGIHDKVWLGVVITDGNKAQYTAWWGKRGQGLSKKPQPVESPWDAAARWQRVVDEKLGDGYHEIDWHEKAYGLKELVDALYFNSGIHSPAPPPIPKPVVQAAPPISTPVVPCGACGMSGTHRLSCGERPCRECGVIQSVGHKVTCSFMPCSECGSIESVGHMPACPRYPKPEPPPPTAIPDRQPTIRRARHADF